jgi:selenocysteine lyase/cysteine desulfurase
MGAVLDWLATEGVTPGEVHDYVVELQEQFMENVTRPPGRLLPSRSAKRGNFLTYELDGAQDYYRALHSRNVVTDFRGDRLRIGFGIYQSDRDVDRLIEIVDSIDAP